MVELILSWIRSREWAQVQRSSIVLLASLVVVVLPVRGEGLRQEEWTSWRDTGIRWAESGDLVRAVESFERALALQRSFGQDRDPDPSAAEARALLAFNYGIALHDLHRDAESLRWLEAAAQDDPTNSRYVRTLADAHRLWGSAPVADSLERQLGTLVGGESHLLISQGWQAMREGHAPRAESLFTRAISLDQNQWGAWTALIRVQVERDRFDEAERTLAGARRVRVPAPMLAAHEALLYAAKGDSVRSLAALQRLSPADIAGNHLIQGVVARARQLLAERSR
jgi:Flp pilus assembly protein TadD